MTGFAQALILLLLPLLLAGLSVTGARLPWPLPITDAAGGGLISLWSAFPAIELDPGPFFLCFVPPLLFADASQSQAGGRSRFMLNDRRARRTP